MASPTLKGLILTIILLAVCGPACMYAQDSNGSPAAPPQDSVADLKREAAELRARLEKLESRIDQLQTRQQISTAKESPVTKETAPPPPDHTHSDQPHSDPPQPDKSISGIGGILAGTTLNLALDGYYEYNFNSPIGRDNLLRAYDVSSNSFSLNQADAVIENAPDPDEGKRWGARLDLQWGQATQSLQGNAINEPRPDIYRAIFQAYGTYVVPIGSGLTLDFGKWASSLGIEGNYTKDQMNYSRSLWFDFLPFYHMGMRATYNITDTFAVHYWLTNGTEQTEAFNGFKDESVGFAWQPRKSFNWTLNYYLGQEHPDVIFYPYGIPAGLGNLPEQQGVPFAPINSPPTGKLHIFDSYVAWQSSPRLSFAGEADWMIERDYTNSPPAMADGGAIYARYQLTSKAAMASRAEYLSDRGGLFSGVPQGLKETTLTLEYKLAEAFLVRAEWRRDFSNHPFFLTDTLGILRREQTTTGLGLVWWFGAKKGAW
jgi:hypothetical protein